MVYIRPAEKEHGTKRRIEGGMAEGKRVVLVEDLVTTGGSALSAIEALRESNLICNHSVSNVNYGFRVAVERFAADAVSHRAIVDTESILGALEASGVPEAEVTRVRSWRRRINETGGAPA